MTAQGHIFIMEYSSESPPSHIAEKEGINPRDYLTWRKTVEVVNATMFALAQTFFEHRAVQLPGLLQFDLGFLNAFGKRMMSDANRIGRPFPDSEFRTQVTFSIEGLLKNNVANEQLLFDQIRQGFDLFGDAPRYSFQSGSPLT